MNGHGFNFVFLYLKQARWKIQKKSLKVKVYLNTTIGVEKRSCHRYYTARMKKKPYAEYWLGSDLHEGTGKLPYLFKVQDVEKMLSIQVHPSKRWRKLNLKKKIKKDPT